MKLFAFAVLFAAVFAAQAEPQCKHSSGAGLTPALHEFIALIPTEKILNIYLEAVSSDVEVQSVMEYISSDEFIKIVKTVTSAPEYRRLLTKSCDTLYFDAEYYLDYIGGILDWPKPAAYRRMRSRAGLRGLVDDVLEQIPVAELKALLDDKLASDKYCQLGISLLKSEDMINIVGAVTKTPQYKFIESELRRMKIDVDAVKSFLNKHLDWPVV